MLTFWMIVAVAIGGPVEESYILGIRRAEITCRTEANELQSREGRMENIERPGIKYKYLCRRFDVNPDAPDPT